ncbi:patatin-like protein 3 [Triticum urartu]|uniref:patatin-like protein 3 n=1 Tax=Triticum urartu TaxID=4572 RepID=UPI002043052D|nr:patatin-like protein 3 [Triticum urartu]
MELHSPPRWGDTVGIRWGGRLEIWEAPTSSGHPSLAQGCAGPDASAPPPPPFPDRVWADTAPTLFEAGHTSHMSTLRSESLKGDRAVPTSHFGNLILEKPSSRHGLDASAAGQRAGERGQRVPSPTKYTAADALAFVAVSLGKGGWARGGGGWRGRWAALFRRRERSSDKSSLSASSSSSSLRRVFGDATLRDTMAPLLVPCYDLTTGVPFLSSRADAVESNSFDFRLRDVCAATCVGGSAAAAVHSVNDLTAIAAAAGGVAAMGNPAAAAITHVLHNKQEFPLAAGVDDLLVVSIRSGSSSGGTASGSATPSAGWRTPIPPRSPSPAKMVRLTAEGVADMVNQAVAMAFGHTCGRNYVCIQVSIATELHLAWSRGLIAFF